jgi:hypothetical protein
MGLFSKPNPPIGFHHFLGTHSVLCKGPIDYISRIRGEDKTVWQGQTTGGEIFIDAVDAYGGQYDGEGGVLGWLDIEMGAADQQKNRYLQGALGTTKIPAHRGVVSAIQKQMYVGITKYPKPLKYLCTRIMTRDDGEEQWYPEKAIIGEYVTIPVPPSMFSLEADNPNHTSNEWTPELGVTVGTPGSPPTIRTYTVQGTWTRWFEGWEDIPSQKYVVKFAVLGDFGALNYFYYGATEEAALEEFHADYPGGVITFPPSSYLQFFLVDTPVDDNGGGHLFVNSETKQVLQGDMNPAHILRELDTSRYYGMRHPESDIDDDAFADAADRLFDERMGFGYLWGFDGTEKSVNDFSNVVCRHIDAIHAVSFQTGKLKLWLIRDDYDPDELPVFDSSNVKRVLSAHCTSPHELVNKVTATYWDPAIGKTRTVCVSNPAAIANGAPVNAAPLDLTGFSSSHLAILGAQRELRSLGNQAWTFEIEVTRVGETVDFGSVVKLNLPNHKAHNLIMRVMDIGIMDTDDATIKLVLSQDLYALPELPVVVQTPDYEDPQAEPQPATPRLVMELPYWALVQREGQAAVDAALAVDPDLGFVGVAAGAPAGSTGADLWIDSGNGYEAASSLTYAVTTTLTGDLPRLSGVITVDGELGIFGIEVGMIGSLNNELVACAEIDVEADPIEITLLRGVLDTLPADHQEGDQIIWWSGSYTTNEEQYTSGSEISAKILTRASGGLLPLSSAPADIVEVDSRAYRAYPPANVKLNGEYWPSEIDGNLEITASGRNRLVQAGAAAVGFFDDVDIAPEDGQTYSYEIYDLTTDDLIYSDSGIASFPIEISAANLAAFSRIELFSVRDGYESFQRYTHEFSSMGTPYGLEAEYEDGVSLLTWSFDGASGDGFNIYRDTSPMDPNALPTPLATVSLSERDYEDTTVTDGETYFYRVSVFLTVPAVENVSSEIEHLAALPSDPDFANVTGLLHFEGAHNSTIFPDEIGNTWTASGNAKLTTSDSMFGTSCLTLDGVDDDIRCASSAAFGFGIGDFTWEAHVKRANGNCVIFDNRSSGSDLNSIVVFIDSSGNLCYYDSSTKTGSGATVPLGAWTYIAVTREANILEMWIGTTKVFSGPKLSDMGSAKPMIIGRDVIGAADFFGQIDEVRFTKKKRIIAPPAEPFPDM